MDAKLKIDLAQGILEVEGSEKFVEVIYQDFKQNLLLKAASDSTLNKKPKPAELEKQNGDGEHNKKKKKTASAQKMPVLVKDLDLLGKGKLKSLKDFVNTYTPKAAMEWNLLFVYYLQKILEIEGIGIDHIYTCYKHVNIKPPTQIYQSLIDTARKKGSINTDSMESIKVTISGENLVEHEMQKNDQPQ